MARKSNIARNKKREGLVSRYAQRRRELKAILKNPKTSDEDFYKAQKQLFSLPRDSSPTRLRNRCVITGRPRAYRRLFGVSRLVFRELALKGQLPGVIKSSW